MEIDEEAGEMSMIAFGQDDNDYVKISELQYTYKYQNYLSEHSYALDMEAIEKLPRRMVLCRSQYQPPVYPGPGAKTFHFFGPGSRRRGLLFPSGREAILGLSRDLLPPGYNELSPTLNREAKHFTELQRHLFSVILRGNGKYNAVVCGSSAKQRSYGYLLPILSQIIDFKQQNCTIGPTLLVITSTFSKAQEIVQRCDTIIKSASVMNREHIPSLFLVSEDRQPTNLADAQCDLLIGTVERLTPYLAHMANLDGAFFDNLRYIVVEQAQYLIPKVDRTEGLEGEDEEENRQISPDEDGSGGYSTSFVNLWFHLPEHIQENLSILMISSRSIPALYDHEFFSLIGNHKDRLFIQDLEIYGHANIHFVKANEMAKHGYLKKLLLMELLGVVKGRESEKRIVVSCSTKEDARRVKTYLEGALLASDEANSLGSDQLCVFLATEDLSTPALEEFEFKVWRAKDVRAAIAVCDMSTGQLIADDGRRTSHLIYYQIPPMKQFNTLLEYAFMSLHNPAASPITFFVNPVEDLQFAEKLYFAAHFYNVEVPTFIRDMYKKWQDGNNH